MLFRSAKSLADQGFFANTRAVVGMLADKDMAGVVSALRGKVDEWHLASLQGPRAASASQLRKAIDEAQAGGTVFMYPSPREAYTAARERCAENDRIVVFGSFLTVAEIASIHSNVLTT